MPVRATQGWESGVSLTSAQVARSPSGPSGRAGLRLANSAEIAQTIERARSAEDQWMVRMAKRWAENSGGGGGGEDDAGGHEEPQWTATRIVRSREPPAKVVPSPPQPSIAAVPSAPLPSLSSHASRSIDAPRRQSASCSSRNHRRPLGRSECDVVEESQLRETGVSGCAPRGSHGSRGTLVQFAAFLRLINRSHVCTYRLGHAFSQPIDRHCTIITPPCPQKCKLTDCP